MLEESISQHHDKNKSHSSKDKRTIISEKLFQIDQTTSKPIAYLHAICDIIPNQAAKDIKKKLKDLTRHINV